MAGIAVFDMNETTLDLAPVREQVDALVGPEGGFKAWFQRLLQLSMTVTATGSYQDFTVLAAAALDAVAATGANTLKPDAWDHIAQAMGHLNGHPDVVDGLSHLRSSGWMIVALTNSAQYSVDTQLERAGLRPLFDHVLSVDSVQAFKPAAAPYLLAAETLGAHPSELWMVASHDWDLAGARAVGMSTAFVRRPGMSYASAFPAPDLDVVDFVELAAALVDPPPV